jgi:hypothetical protein
MYINEEIKAKSLESVVFILHSRKAPGYTNIDQNMSFFSKVQLCPKPREYVLQTSRPSERQSYATHALYKKCFHHLCRTLVHFCRHFLRLHVLTPLSRLSTLLLRDLDMLHPWLVRRIWHCRIRHHLIREARTSMPRSIHIHRVTLNRAAA